METKNAIRVSMFTLLGVYIRSYPTSHGNCFSVRCDDGTEFKIVNFVLENIQEAERRGLSWPVKIKTLSDSHAVIHDERIPHAWYTDRWCEICCPESLLPIPQRFAHERDEACGARKNFSYGVVIDPSKRPKW